MVARSITIVAPIANEWAAPTPIIIMFGFSIIGIITSLTFPGEDEFIKGLNKEEKTYNMNESKNSEADSDLT